MISEDQRDWRASHRGAHRLAMSVRFAETSRSRIGRIGEDASNVRRRHVCSAPGRRMRLTAVKVPAVLVLVVLVGRVRTLSIVELVIKPRIYIYIRLISTSTRSYHWRVAVLHMRVQVEPSQRTPRAGSKPPFRGPDTWKKVVVSVVSVVSDGCSNVYQRALDVFNLMGCYQEAVTKNSQTRTVVNQTVRRRVPSLCRITLFWRR